MTDTEYVLGRRCIKTTPLDVTCCVLMHGMLHASCCDNSAENSLFCNLQHWSEAWLHFSVEIRIEIYTYHFYETTLINTEFLTLCQNLYPSILCSMLRISWAYARAMQHARKTTGSTAQRVSQTGEFIHTTGKDPLTFLSSCDFSIFFLQQSTLFRRFFKQHNTLWIHRTGCLGNIRSSPPGCF